MTRWNLPVGRVGGCQDGFADHTRSRRPSTVNSLKSTPEEIVEVFVAPDADLDRPCDLTFDALTTPERLRALERRMF